MASACPSQFVRTDEQIEKVQEKDLALPVHARVLDELPRVLVLE